MQVIGARQALKGTSQLAGGVARSARRAAADALLTRNLPRDIGDIDDATLSRIMGRTVTQVRVLEQAEGTTSRARLALEGDQVPSSVFIKLQPSDRRVRMMGEFAHLGDTEVRFYRHLAPQILGVPEALGVDHDPATGRYVLVLEDLTTSQCEFPDILNPLTPDQAESLVELLARVHGRFWGRLPSLGDRRAPLGWLIQPSVNPPVPMISALL